MLDIAFGDLPSVSPAGARALLGRHEEAIEAFQWCLEADPKNLECRRALEELRAN